MQNQIKSIVFSSRHNVASDDYRYNVLELSSCSIFGVGSFDFFRRMQGKKVHAFFRSANLIHTIFDEVSLGNGCESRAARLIECMRDNLVLVLLDFADIQPRLVRSFSRLTDRRKDKRTSYSRLSHFSLIFEMCRYSYGIPWFRP